MDNNMILPSSSGLFANGIRTSISEVLYNYAFFCPSQSPSEVLPQPDHRIQLSSHHPPIPIPHEPSNQSSSLSILSLFFFLSCICFSVSAYSNKKHDLILKQSSVHHEALRHFYENQCEDPVPMTQEKCLEWEVTIAKDPLSTNSAEIVCAVIADIYDGINSRLPITSFILIISLALIICSFLLHGKRQ